VFLANSPAQQTTLVFVVRLVDDDICVYCLGLRLRQNKLLRLMTGALWFVLNDALHKAFQIEPMGSFFWRNAITTYERLQPAHQLITDKWAKLQNWVCPAIADGGMDSKYIKWIISRIIFSTYIWARKFFVFLYDRIEHQDIPLIKKIKIKTKDIQQVASFESRAGGLQPTPGANEEGRFLSVIIVCLWLS
jgi:hypothetical protein